MGGFVVSVNPSTLFLEALRLEIWGLPVGTKETSKIWYANARLAVAVAGVRCWGGKLGVVGRWLHSQLG